MHIIAYEKNKKNPHVLTCLNTCKCYFLMSLFWRCLCND